MEYEQLKELQYLEYSTIQNKSITIENTQLSFGDSKLDFDYQELKETLSAMKYPHFNGQWSEYASKFNPLEVDRTENFIYYNQKYYKTYQTPYGTKARVKFPVFNKVFWYLVAWLQRVPTFREFAQGYLLLSTRHILEFTDNAYLFIDGKSHKPDNLQQQLIFNNNEIFINRLLKFKQDNNLPINQVTTEQVLYRLYKVYGSLIRDLYHPIAFGALGASVYYNNELDNNGGIDLIVNNVPCFAYTSTKAAEKFAQDKQRYRHWDYIKRDEFGEVIGIKIMANVKNKIGIVLPSDELISQIIKDINNNTVAKEYRYD